MANQYTVEEAKSSWEASGETWTPEVEAAFRSKGMLKEAAPAPERPAMPKDTVSVFGPNIDINRNYTGPGIYDRLNPREANNRFAVAMARASGGFLPGVRDAKGELPPDWQPVMGTEKIVDAFGSGAGTALDFAVLAPAVGAMVPEAGVGLVARGLTAARVPAPLVPSLARSAIQTPMLLGSHTALGGGSPSEVARSVLEGEALALLPGAPVIRNIAANPVGREAVGIGSLAGLNMANGMPIGEAFANAIPMHAGLRVGGAISEPFSSIIERSRSEIPASPEAGSAPEKSPRRPIFGRGSTPQGPTLEELVAAAGPAEPAKPTYDPGALDAANKAVADAQAKVDKVKGATPKTAKAQANQKVALRMAEKELAKATEQQAAARSAFDAAYPDAQQAPEEPTPSPAASNWDEAIQWRSEEIARQRADQARVEQERAAAELDAARRQQAQADWEAAQQAIADRQAQDLAARQQASVPVAAPETAPVAAPVAPQPAPVVAPEPMPAPSPAPQVVDLRGNPAQNGRDAVAGAIGGVTGDTWKFRELRDAVSTSKTKIGEWFAGVGTLRAALKNVDSVHVVEYEPRFIAEYNGAHGTNHKPQDIKLVTPKMVADSGADHFHASPECKRSSWANRNPVPNENDMDQARAIAGVIDKSGVPSISVENVPRYKNTEAYRIITEALNRAGYTWDAPVYDAADLGAPQHRTRMLIRAVKSGELPPLPGHKPAGDWYETIKDLIPEAPDSQLGPDEMQRIQNFVESGRLDPSRPIITMGESSFKGAPNAANAGGPAPVLVSSPNSVPRIVFPNGTVKRVTPRMMARLMGLPENFKLPENNLTAKQVIGNGMDARFTEALIQPLVDTATSRRGSSPAIVDPTAQQPRPSTDLTLGSGPLQAMYEAAARAAKGRGRQITEGLKQNFDALRAQLEADIPEMPGANPFIHYATGKKSWDEAMDELANSLKLPNPQGLVTPGEKASADRRTATAEVNLEILNDSLPKELVDNLESLGLEKNLGERQVGFTDPLRKVQQVADGTLGSAIEVSTVHAQQVIETALQGKQTQVGQEFVAIKNATEVKSNADLEIAGKLREFYEPSQGDAAFLNNPEVQALLSQSSVGPAPMLEIVKQTRAIENKILDQANANRRALGLPEIGYRDFYFAKLPKQPGMFDIREKVRRSAAAKEDSRTTTSSSAKVTNARTMHRSSTDPNVVELNGREVPREWNLEKVLERYVDQMLQTIGGDVALSQSMATVEWMRNKAVVVENSGDARAAEQWHRRADVVQNVAQQRWNHQLYGGALFIENLAGIHPSTRVLRDLAVANKRQFDKTKYTFNPRFNVLTQPLSTWTPVARDPIAAALALKDMTRPSAWKFARSTQQYQIKSRPHGAMRQQIDGTATFNDAFHGGTKSVAKKALGVLRGGVTNAVEDYCNLFAALTDVHINNKNPNLTDRQRALSSGQAVFKTQSAYSFPERPALLNSRTIQSAWPAQAFKFEVFNQVREALGQVGVDSRVYGATRPQQLADAGAILASAILQNYFQNAINLKLAGKSDEEAFDISNLREATMALPPVVYAFLPQSVTGVRPQGPLMVGQLDQATNAVNSKNFRRMAATGATNWGGVGGSFVGDVLNGRYSDIGLGSKDWRDKSNDFTSDSGGIPTRPIKSQAIQSKPIRSRKIVQR